MGWGGVMLSPCLPTRLDGQVKCFTKEKRKRKNKTGHSVTLAVFAWARTERLNPPGSPRCFCVLDWRETRRLTLLHLLSPVTYVLCSGCFSTTHPAPASVSVRPSSLWASLCHTALRPDSSCGGCQRLQGSHQTEVRLGVG